jgi:osmoprotectant transport system substrate-binding protein
MTHKRRAAVGRRAVLGLAAGISAVLTLSACAGGGNPLETPTGSAPAAEGSSTPVVVGSADFPESQTIAEIYAGALNAAGIEATTKLSIGTREIYVRALQDGSIDLIPDYSGNLLGYLDPANTVVEADQILAALPEKLPEGLGVLEAAEAQNKDAMVVTAATAEEYGLTSITDLAEVCGELTLGAPAEFAERPYGLPGLKEKYGCEFKSFEPINDGGGAITLQALISDQIQVADIFTTTPSIEDNGLVVLEDPENNWLAQQVLPLVKEDRIDDAAAEALNRVSGMLTTEDLISLNRAVSGDQKQNPKDAAADWLREKGITS